MQGGSTEGGGGASEGDGGALAGRAYCFSPSRTCILSSYLQTPSRCCHFFCEWASCINVVFPPLISFPFVLGLACFGECLWDDLSSS